MTTLNKLYANMLVDIYLHGDIIHPRGMLTKEIRNYILVLENIEDNVITLPHVATNLVYANEELRWYLTGTDKIDYSPLIKKVWKKYSDDGKTVNSNYGHRIFGVHSDFPNQWDWIVEELQEDPESRRAVINLNYPGDKDSLETKDFVCTMFIQCFIRNEKLHWTVVMRSNDAYYGFRNDVFCFTSMQQMMAAHLGIESGTYTHIVGSMHLYEKDFKKVQLLIDEGVVRVPEEVLCVEYPLDSLRRVMDRRVFKKDGARK